MKEITKRKLWKLFHNKSNEIWIFGPKYKDTLLNPDGESLVSRGYQRKNAPMMQRSKRTELRALREVAHFLLPLLCCEFCGKPLLEPELADKKFGNKAHKPLRLSLTVHHRDGNHGNNKRKYCLLPIDENLNTEFGSPIGNTFSTNQFAICGNTSLTHRKCHCQYELKLRREREKKMVKK